MSNKRNYGLMAEMHLAGWLHRDDMEEFLRDVAAHGKRAHSIKAHQLLVLVRAINPENTSTELTAIDG